MRSQKTVFSSLHGTVRVYTRRHINGCPLQNPNEQNCPCPKWIYSHAKSGNPSREAAGTPSFSEACEKAQKVLRGFDPEIRAARELTQPAPGIAIEAALERYFGILAGRKVSADYLKDIRRFFYRAKPSPKPRRPRQNPSLLDFLDGANLIVTAPITRMEQITSDTLDDWQATWRSNDLTAKVWRTQARSFFKWALKKGYVKLLLEFDRGPGVRAGNRCGHFTADQYTRILEALPFYRSGGRMNLPPTFAARMRAFIEAGRWGAMAICDIVLFSPARSLGADNILRYRRHKNRNKGTSPVAVIELEPEIARRLRTVPPEKGTDPEQPFRFAGTDLEENCEIWRLRFQKLCAFAGISEIETEIGRRNPHPHMLRDTFAIDEIIHGAPLENVAMMLGHATTAMTQRHYLFWTLQRTDSAIANRRASLARRVQDPPAGERSAFRPLVH